MDKLDSRPRLYGRRSPTKTRQHARRVGASLLLGVLLTGLGLVVPSSAQAVTVRPGAHFGQIDVLLDAYETEQVRRSFWAATVVCWQTGVASTLMSLGVCQTAITVCAARAYYESPRRRAGMTVTPWGGYWCWKY